MQGSSDGDTLDDASEHSVIRVAVLLLRAGREIERPIAKTPNDLLRRHLFSLEGIKIVRIDVVGDARVVREQVVSADAVPRGGRGGQLAADRINRAQLAENFQHQAGS